MVGIEAVRSQLRKIRERLGGAIDFAWLVASSRAAEKGFVREHLPIPPTKVEELRLGAKVRELGFGPPSLALDACIALLAEATTDHA
jgi:hypothetical protein